MESRNLIDSLVEDEAPQRLVSVAESFCQIEGYMRTLALVLGGLTVKANGEMLSDLVSAQLTANDFVFWLSANANALATAATNQTAQAIERSKHEALH